MSAFAISVVVPVYNEQDSLVELHNRIRSIADSNPELSHLHLIFVDDGSTDASWTKICELASHDQKTIGLRLRRNFGKATALDAGFRRADEGIVLTMDADLQDSPDEIPALYDMIAKEGFHMVSGWKKKRHDPLSKTIPSKFFNYITRKLSGIKLHDFNCGLKAYQLSVVKNIQVYGEMHRYIPVILKWAGFTKITEKIVEHHERKYGTTKFGFERFINGFLDLLSITFVSRFRQKPMHFFGTWGTLSFLVGFIFTLKLFWDKMDALFISKTPFKRDITEQPIFYIALVAVVIGVQLFVTGFLAEMFAMQSLSRRDYLIIDKVGLEEKLAGEPVGASFLQASGK